MGTVNDAGPVALRTEFPGGAGRTLATAFFPVLAAPALFLLVRYHAGIAGIAGFLAMVVAGFLVTLRILKRKPTALEVREKSLVLLFGSRAEAIEWPAVRGVEQVIIGVAPAYVVLFHGRRRLEIGSGDRGVALAQEIVRRAGLRWLHEPFSAAR